MQTKNLGEEGVKMLFKSSIILIQLGDLVNDFMYLIEFSISFRQQIDYGWASAGVKGFLDLNVEPFSMSFISASWDRDFIVFLVLFL